jgi:hypothetical protein
MACGVALLLAGAFAFAFAREPGMEELLGMAVPAVETSGVAAGLAAAGAGRESLDGWV